jgi:tetratricopeptide (TPR) repeat protein
MEDEIDFYTEFNRLQDGLKKRLFKKIDYTSSADQFLELGNSMRREGNAPNAALCFMSAAQCYRATKDLMKDAYYESEAGRLFWKTQLESEQSDPLGLIGGYEAPLRELVPEAEDCYITAIETYLGMGEYNMASSLYSELAANVYALGRKEQACIYYEKAAQLVERDSPHLAAACIEQAISCKVEIGDFESAHEASNLCLGTAPIAMPFTQRNQSRQAVGWRIAVLERRSCPWEDTVSIRQMPDVHAAVSGSIPFIHCSMSSTYQFRH